MVLISHRPLDIGLITPRSGPLQVKDCDDAVSVESCDPIFYCRLVARSPNTLRALR